ncbi:MAG: hypothetical protein CMJ46_03875 [Planctomyces sp.]|nr:hypothetical protein [Planctomyces sp.]
MCRVVRFHVLLMGSVLLIAGWGSRSLHAETLVELSNTNTKASWIGRVEGQNQTHCWLMGQDGVLHQIALKDVTNFRRVSPQFKRLTTLQMKSQLHSEFGRDFEVATTARYITVAPRGTASAYVKLFDQVYRQFYSYFKLRGMNLDEPEFPMVSVIFPDQQQFIDYCRQDGVRYQPELQGYYQPRTNRVALYIPTNQVTWQSPSRVNSSLSLRKTFEQSPSPFPTVDTFSQSEHYANLALLDEELANTIIHEGTHQVAFNMNLHSRLGDNPRWVVEGLAMVFESPGIRTASRVTEETLNRERFLWFGDYSSRRRPDNALANFVVSDNLFNSSALDAYSEAWALSYYLLETRPRQYVDYLKLVSTHSNGRRYTPEERLTDFQEVIHSNLTKIESDYLRYHERLRR